MVLWLPNTTNRVGLSLHYVSYKATSYNVYTGDPLFVTQCVKIRRCHGDAACICHLQWHAHAAGKGSIITLLCLSRNLALYSTLIWPIINRQMMKITCDMKHRSVPYTLKAKSQFPIKLRIANTPLWLISCADQLLDGYNYSMMGACGWRQPEKIQNYFSGTVAASSTKSHSCIATN